MANFVKEPPLALTGTNGPASPSYTFNNISAGTSSLSYVSMNMPVVVDLEAVPLPAAIKHIPLNSNPQKIFQVEPAELSPAVLPPLLHGRAHVTRTVRSPPSCTIEMWSSPWCAPRTA